MVWSTHVTPSGLVIPEVVREDPSPSQATLAASRPTNTTRILIYFPAPIRAAASVIVAGLERMHLRHNLRQSLQRLPKPFVHRPARPSHCCHVHAHAAKTHPLQRLQFRQALRWRTGDGEPVDDLRPHQRVQFLRIRDIRLKVPPRGLRCQIADAPGIAPRRPATPPLRPAPGSGRHTGPRYAAPAPRPATHK